MNYIKNQTSALKIAHITDQVLSALKYDKSNYNFFTIIRKWIEIRIPMLKQRSGIDWTLETTRTCQIITKHEWLRVPSCVY
jgi:hypothetical protein